MISQYLKEDVDPEFATWPLTAYCFLTGWMCVFFFIFHYELRFYATRRGSELMMKFFTAT